MLVSGVIAGALIGLAVGRDWRRLELLRIVWLPAIVVAVLIRAIAPFLPDGAILAYLFSIGLTALVAGLNWRLPGAALIALGSMLNLVAVVANGAMPVDQIGLEAIGGRMPTDGLHEPLGADSQLSLLADVILVAPLRAAYSTGDITIALGGFVLPFVTLIRR